MAHICVYIDNLDRLEFFSNLCSIIEQKGHAITFITSRLSVHRSAIKQGKKSHICQKPQAIFEVDLSGNFDVKGKWLTIDNARRLYSSIIENLTYLHQKSPIHYCFIWNGSRVPGKALNDFSKQYQIQTGFFEIGNFPGKLFFNSEGVNAKSNLAREITTADKETMEIYRKWRDRYIAFKKEKQPIPQSKLVKKFNWNYIVDIAGREFLKIPANDNVPVFKKLYNQILRYKDNNILCQKRPNNPYILLALQTNQDSQIIINSKISQLEAIAFAKKEAKKRNIPLVIKIHPAETDHNFLREIAKLENNEKIVFCNDDSYELISHSETVITINSTIGLEAMIHNKECIILGDSFYKNFTKSQLAQYIINELIDYDYFHHINNEPDLVNRILGI